MTAADRPETVADIVARMAQAATDGCDISAIQIDRWCDDLLAAASPERPEGVPQDAPTVTAFVGAENADGGVTLYLPTGRELVTWGSADELRDAGVPVPPYQEPQPERTAAERLAEKFHEAYERLAPEHGYTTRHESAVPWDGVPEQNRSLMIAVCDELLAGWTEEAQP